MPRYDYKCDACSHRFEEKQSFSSEPVAVCPECAGRASRQFVAVPVVFKGSGFYVNDYGKNGSTTKAKSNNDSSSDSDSKSESKTEKSETTTAKAETTPAASTSTSDSKAD
ncbi:MAG: hypothetical protein BZY79_00355 [SAR202 cluster bacterium Casp-Chloro-G4]|nr:FmdB family transcriptional regulator [Chloroflexota bacterium]PKB62121.1 MAG: hypothetical protein BZY79_00355 [SAR202 cluster bacterium Casp-Chloro-G4]